MNSVGSTISSGLVSVVVLFSIISPKVPRSEQLRPIVLISSLVSDLKNIRPRIVVKIGFRSIQGAVKEASDRVRPRQKVSWAMKTPIKPERTQRPMCFALPWRRISPSLRTVRVQSRSMIAAPMSACISKNI